MADPRPTGPNLLVDEQVRFARRFKVRAPGVAPITLMVTGENEACFIKVPGAGWVLVGEWPEFRLLDPLGKVQLAKSRFHEPARFHERVPRARAN